MYWYLCFFFLFRQKTAYEMRISDWSSDVCSSDLTASAPIWKACTTRWTAATCRPARLRRAVCFLDLTVMTPDLFAAGPGPAERAAELRAQLQDRKSGG